MKKRCSSIPRLFGRGVMIALSCFGAACSTVQEQAECPAPPARDSVSPPDAVSCANADLTQYDSLLVLAPHPDDETLGFAGLRTAYMKSGKSVEVVVVTDGDAYCEACSLWKNTALVGETCDARDLSNFATPEVDSFAEVRRQESRASAAVLGTPEPEFLGYPDTGLAKAWQHFRAGKPEATLHRSDFSSCGECSTCGAGYGGGPETDLTSDSLRQALRDRLVRTSERTLIATTHPLDGHGDHAALGKLVEAVNQDLSSPRSLAFAVIHSHAPKDGTPSDCWYPGPASTHCRCAVEECASEDAIAARRAFRFRPEWPSALPDDADYGLATHLCLDEELYMGAEARKLEAIRAYPSQLGFLSRVGAMPNDLAGIMDCSGYLLSFVRRTESFVLVDN